jgi:hypothetical protein
VLYSLAKNPTKLLLKQLAKAGWTDAPIVLRKIVELGNPTKYRNLHTNDVVNRFARRSHEQRIDTQTILIDRLTGIETDASSIARKNVVGIIIGERLEKRGLIPCIGKDGIRGYVPADSIKDMGWAVSRGVPVDYRHIDKPVIEQQDYYGNYMQEFFSIEARALHPGDNRTHMTTISHRGTSRKLRDVTIVPAFTWRKKDGVRDFDLSWRDEHFTDGDIPERRIHDGLFGLIVVHYLSQDFAMPETRPLRTMSTKVEQGMGAAQLPLLTLMFRDKIENSSLVQAIEAFAQA